MKKRNDEQRCNVCNAYNIEAGWSLFPCDDCGFAYHANCIEFTEVKFRGPLDSPGFKRRMWICPGCAGYKL